jgi:acetyl-CoA carboxylase biotin carboxyl carrier protein
MDFKTIKNLLKLISESDVNEMEVEEGDFRIKIKKQPDTHVTQGPPTMYTGHALPVDVAAPSAPAQPAPRQAGAAEQSEEQASNTITVRSPIVGTYYSAPSPESDAYVNVGDTVTKGDVLCIIEAMKIMNEVESEHSGKIVKILVDNTQPVEFDQPLFLIDPS